MPISLQTPAGAKHDNNSIDDPEHGYIYMDIDLDNTEELSSRSWIGSTAGPWLLLVLVTAHPFTENSHQKRVLHDYDRARQRQNTSYHI